MIFHSITLILTMPTRAQEGDEDEAQSDENMNQLRKNQLSISLALGRRKKRK